MILSKHCVIKQVNVWINLTFTKHGCLLHRHFSKAKHRRFSSHFHQPIDF